MSEEEEEAIFEEAMAGQILTFHRAVKGIVKHESTEVVRAGSEGILVCTLSGVERALTGKHANSFDVVEKKPIEVASGDPPANRESPRRGLTNH